MVQVQALAEVDQVLFFSNTYPPSVVALLFIFGVPAREKLSVINF